MRTKITVGLLFIVVFSSAAADSLSDAKALSGTGLQPLELPDLSASDSLARQAMQEAREQVNRDLKQGAGQAEWVKSLERLCMLYHAHDVDRVSVSCYNNLRTLRPDSWRWHYYSGYLSQKAGYPELALQSYAEGEQATKADYPPLNLRKGQAWLDLNRLGYAEQAFSAAQSEPGLEASAAYGLGQVAMLKRQYPKAIEYFERSLALQPQATRVHFPLAQALRAAGRMDEARDHLSRQGKGTPQADDPLIMAAQRMATGARPRFMEAMDAIKDKDYPTAILAFQEGLEMEPDNNDARVSLARAYYLNGQSDEARQQLEMTAQQKGSLHGRFLLGLLQHQEGSRDEARRNYLSVLKQQPTHGGAHFYLGRLALEDQQWEQAAQYARESIRFDASNYPAYFVLLTALGQLGDDEAMLEWINRARQRFSDQPVFDYALVRLQCLAADPQQRDPPAALDLAGALVEKIPVPPHQALFALALAANGNFDSAAELQDQFLKMSMWMPFAASAARDLEAYQAGRLPETSPWPLDDPVLMPGPLNVGATIGGYPVAKPF